MSDIHLFIDFYAIAHNLILLALFITAKATDNVYVTIHDLKRLCLYRDLLIYGFLYKALQLKVQKEDLWCVLLQKVYLTKIILRHGILESI